MTQLPIDFRSDTVTRPTSEMLAAMMAAPVGDDVWGDDPTVLALQEEVSAQVGKEAALFLPSGTQSNLAALMAHCERGDEYIVGQLAHTYKFEGGGAAVLGSIVPQPIENESDGSLPLSKIESAIKHHGPGLGAHFARTRLLALENTYNGTVLNQGYVKEATQFVRERGLATHLDGARACHAAVAQEYSLEEICQDFDSVSICFSKGMGAPVGSVLAGTKEMIDRAYRWRKVLGGGMRQSGFLAAACLYALRHHLDRLAEDHAHAERLATKLAEIEEIDVRKQATNMVFVKFDKKHCASLEDFLSQQGILAQIIPESRFVTHLDIKTKDVDAFAEAIKQYFQASGAS